MENPRSFWKSFSKHTIGYISLIIVMLFCLAGIYAPLLASSKPIVVYYQGEWYFPLFRYLFFNGFYTKYLDIFYNITMFTAPFGIALYFILKKSIKFSLIIFFILQFSAFVFLIFFPVKDPARSILTSAKSGPLTWNDETSVLTPYEQLNLILRWTERKNQHLKLQSQTTQPVTSSLWSLDEANKNQTIERMQENILRYPNDSANARTRLQYIEDKERWLEEHSQAIKFIIMPLISPFHWEEDAGGSQQLNLRISWFELTRINRKDLMSALIFGIRISLSVGLIAIAMALLIGIPIGAIAGYYGGKTDIIICRLIELWESMPTFFMLLMVVAFLQSKSIFLVITVIGLFGWTTFSRYIRGEFLKQKKMAYVESCYAMGFSDRRTIFSHLLPNAIPPLMTLVPFAIMGAITSEAGLSFLGLGEDNSCSWGVLMDEGRSAFPAESDLLWPPAILLTLLLVSIALVGDALRDTLDPKLRG